MVISRGRVVCAAVVVRLAVVASSLAWWWRLHFGQLANAAAATHEGLNVVWTVAQTRGGNIGHAPEVCKGTGAFIGRAISD